MTDQSPATTKSNLLRNVAWFIVGVMAGLAVALVLLIAIELASAVVHPFPADFMGTREEICAHVARYPHWILAVVVPAWAFTAYAATWTAKRLGTRPAAITVDLLLSAALIVNVSMLPYPLWFKIFAVVGVMSGALFAIRFHR